MALEYIVQIVVGMLALLVATLLDMLHGRWAKVGLYARHFYRYV